MDKLFLNITENIISLNELPNGQYILRIVDREGNQVHSMVAKI